jgi:two-component system CheB/CheR fusion protein
VSCRNFLIYLNDKLQQQVLGVFHYALKPEGFLFLGNSETLGKSANLFTVLNRKHKLFQKSESTKLPSKLWSNPQTQRFGRVGHA